MSAIADNLRAVHGTLISLPCVVASPSGKWMSTSRRCVEGATPCARCHALAAFPDPDAVGRLETQNAQLHDELGTRGDALGERTRQRDGVVERLIDADVNIAELRGLIAECLALTPSISGDMEKVRVWNDVVLRMKVAALAKLEEKP